MIVSLNFVLDGSARNPLGYRCIQLEASLYLVCTIFSEALNRMRDRVGERSYADGCGMFRQPLDCVRADGRTREAGWFRTFDT